MAEPSSAPPADILVLAPNWLGDVVMTTPLLSWLAEPARRFRGRPLRIHLAVRRAWAPLFEGDPRLSGLVAVERPGRHAGFGGVWRLAGVLRANRYDAVLLGPPSLRAGLVAFLAGIPERVGHRSDGRGFLLTRGLDTFPRGTRHFAREMIDLGASLLDEGEGEIARPVASLPGCRSLPGVGIPEGPPLIAYAPGTTYGEAKTWPADRAAEFLTLLLAGDGHRVVLLGDGQAGGLAKSLAHALGVEAASDLEWGCPLTDLTGRTGLREVAAVLEACAGFVGNDSGLMHLAAALGVPTVGIFGSSNPDWTAPLGPRTAAVVAEGYECRPCYRRTCNQPRFCLEDVSGARVLQTLHGLMAVTGEGGGR